MLATVRLSSHVRPRAGADTTLRCETNNAWKFAAVWNNASALEAVRVPSREGVPEGMEE